MDWKYDDGTKLAHWARQGPAVPPQTRTNLTPTQKKAMMGAGRRLKACARALILGKFFEETPRNKIEFLRKFFQD